MSRYLHLGYDITDGLDGEELRHEMSSDRGHIVVWGPEAERAQFRAKLIAQVEEEGYYDLIEADFSQMSLQTVKDEVLDRADQHTPAFVVLTNMSKEEQSDYALWLLRVARSRGQTIYVEYDGAPSAAREAAVHASTVVLLGPGSKDAAYSVVGLYGAPNCTNEYVACNSTFFKPVSAVLT